MSMETSKVQIIKKAWEDQEFKAKLLADPKSAIQETFGMEIPAEIKIKAVEETTSQFYLVIPPNPEKLKSGVVAPNYTWN